MDEMRVHDVGIQRAQQLGERPRIGVETERRHAQRAVEVGRVPGRVVEPVYMWALYALAAIGLFCVPFDFVALALLLFAYQSVWAALFVGATRYRISFAFLLALLAAAALARFARRRA